MYNQEAHEKAAKAANKLMNQRAPLMLGREPVFINYRCTEPVIEVLQPLCPLKWDRLADVTMGIGAGFSNMGEVCGALSGAVIAIGLDLAGRYRDTAVLRFLTIKFTQKLMRDFAKEFGGVRCRDIIGHDISGCLTPGDPGYRAFLKDMLEGKLRPCSEMITYAIMYPLPSEQEDLHPPL
ncbi:MAG: C-GCAxxG-C-C family protein [Proteobacteria bacterium]|nr:C-GCAxxG-C-C family protein [Pseudomonadota bacterium]